MVKRDAAPVGAPCWIDLMSPDTEASRNFYTELFGWSAGESSEEFGGYFMFLKDDLPVAGCMPSMDDPSTPPEWSVYLASDDANKTVDLIVAGGGEVLAPSMEVADLGTMAITTDAGGARIGVWQPNTFQGLGVVAETGARCGLS